MKAKRKGVVCKTSIMFYNERKGYEVESQVHAERLRGNLISTRLRCARQGSDSWSLGVQNNNQCTCPSYLDAVPSAVTHA